MALRQEDLGYSGGTYDERRPKLRLVKSREPQTKEEKAEETLVFDALSRVVRGGVLWWESYTQLTQTHRYSAEGLRISDTASRMIVKCGLAPQVTSPENSSAENEKVLEVYEGHKYDLPEEVLVILGARADRRREAGDLSIVSIFEVHDDYILPPNTFYG